MEQELSGYVPLKESELVDREKMLDEAAEIAHPTDRELPAEALIPSGIDQVIWFETTRDECARRAMGRRKDTKDEKVYHVEDAQPMTTAAPLCERLIPLDEADNEEGTLVDRFVAFDQSSKGLNNWLKTFGV